MKDEKEIPPLRGGGIPPRGGIRRRRESARTGAATAVGLFAMAVVGATTSTAGRAQDAGAGGAALADSNGSGVAGQRFPLFGPFANHPGRWDGARDAIVAAGAAPPERRTARLDARRLFAERRARDAALASIHRFADDAMATARTMPTVATAVHRVVDRRARVAATRWLTDGGAVVELEVPGAALRRASGERGVLPWHRSGP